MIDPTRVLVVGDAHGDTQFMLRAVDIAEERGCEAIVQVGDFGVWPGDAGRQYLDRVNEACVYGAITIVFVPGNHDDYDQLDAVPVDPVDGFQKLRSRIWAAPPRSHLVVVWGGVPGVGWCSVD